MAANGRYSHYTTGQEEQGIQSHFTPYVERETGSFHEESEGLSADQEKLNVVGTLRKKNPYTHSSIIKVGSFTEVIFSKTGGSTKSYVEPRSVPSLLFIKAMRSNFLSPILISLQGIQEYAGTSGAAMYVEQILQKVREMHDTLPGDSIIEVLRALYDSMVSEANWVNYTAEQYQKAYEILEVLSKRIPVTKKDYERAIVRLEKTGFDTLAIPFMVEEVIK
jgi:hypothetical protein